MSEMKPVDLEAIMAAANLSTMDPWVVDCVQGLYAVVSSAPPGVICGWGTSHENAAFISRARSDIPALCSEVETLRARVSELEAAAKKFIDKATAEKMVSELISAYREFNNPAIHEIDFVDQACNYADARQKVVSALTTQVTKGNGEKVKE